jgi:hypothetical protein
MFDGCIAVVSSRESSGASTAVFRISDKGAAMSCLSVIVACNDGALSVTMMLRENGNGK